MCRGYIYIGLTKFVFSGGGGVYLICAYLVPCANLAVPCANLAVPCANLAVPCANLAVPCAHDLVVPCYICGTLL